MKTTFKYRMDDLLDNSFRDYHARGLDYLCFKRTPEKTTKIYLFDEVKDDASDVVNPHDHRYDFTTWVLGGSMSDHRFSRKLLGHSPDFQAYYAYDYLPPALGGDGFTYRGMEHLYQIGKTVLLKGNKLKTPVDNIHTIRIVCPTTALLLKQGPDLIDASTPTSTWTRNVMSLNTSGLYSRFIADQVRDRLKRLRDINPALEFREVE